MFSRLTLETLITSENGSSKIRDFAANLPLNGATKTSMELSINQEVVLPFTANQHGMAFLILSTESISVRLQKDMALSEPFDVMSSTGQYHAMHRKRPLDERVNLDDKYFIIIKNTSGLVAKVAALYT